MESSYIVSFRTSLQSHILWVALYVYLQYTKSKPPQRLVRDVFEHIQRVASPIYICTLLTFNRERYSNLKNREITIGND